MSTNFREVNFGIEGNKLLSEFYYKLNNHQIIDINDLDHLKNVLIRTYEYNYINQLYRIDDIKDEKILQVVKATASKTVKIRAIEIFSEFLHHLIYYICHDAKISNYSNKQIKIIINYPNFFYICNYDAPPYLTIWIDPKNSYTAFNSLIEVGYLEYVEFFIEKLRSFDSQVGSKALRICFEQQDKYKNSPLINAIKNAQTNIVKILLKQVKEMFAIDRKLSLNYLNLKEEHGFTALLIACKNGNCDVVKLLLNEAKQLCKNPDEFIDFMTQKDDYGFTPLITASKEGHTDVVELLLATADEFSLKYKQKYPNFLIDFLILKNKSGFTALNASCKEGKIDIVKNLFYVIKDFPELTPKILENVLLDSDEHGFFPLMSAIKANENDIVHLLLNSSVISSLMSKDQYGAFFTRLLLLQNKDGYTVIHTACRSYNLIGMSHLLSRMLELPNFGVSYHVLQEALTLTDKFGFSPLISAVKENRIDIVKELLEYVVKIFKNDKELGKNILLQTNQKGYSALISASSQGYVEIVEALLTKAQIILGNDMDGYFKLFSQKNDYGNTVLISAIIENLKTVLNQNRINSVKMLLKYMLNIFKDDNEYLKKIFFQTNMKGYSVLNCAASLGHIEIVELLLIDAQIIFKNDMNGYFNFLRQQNEQGKTPYDSAKKQNHSQVVELLKKAETKINIVNGNTNSHTSMLTQENVLVQSTSNQTFFRPLESDISDSSASKEQNSSKRKNRDSDESSQLNKKSKFT